MSEKYVVMYHPALVHTYGKYGVSPSASDTGPPQEFTKEEAEECIATIRDSNVPISALFAVPIDYKNKIFEDPKTSEDSK